MTLPTNAPDQRIRRFIRRHHVLTLATCGEHGPWCANLFYAYAETDNRLIFTTDTNTRHGTEALVRPNAAASIVLETRTVGRVQGLQIEGRVRPLAEDELGPARKVYLRRFPYAAAAPLSLWVLEPSAYKLTDNTLGFGKKLCWNKTT